VQSAREAFVEYVRREGLKVTRQRLAILETILRSERAHFNAEDLVAMVNAGRGPKASRSSVYRTLELLKDCGLLRKEMLHDQVSHYEKTVGEEHHDHMICNACGCIIEFSSEELERLQDKLCREQGFKPESHVLHIRGICHSCAAKQRKPKS
jgi:Fur family ferric uptake transcriptional regulator